MAAAASVAALGCGNEGSPSDPTGSKTADARADRGALTDVEAVLRDCDSRVEGPALAARATRDLTAGPVTFYGLLDQAGLPRSEFRTRRGRTVKTVTEVDAEADVTVVISSVDRERLALIYEAFGEIGKRGFEAGSAAVRFQGCPAAEPRFSGGGSVGPRTQFNGGFIVLRPGCYGVEVLPSDGQPSNHRIGFGVGGSGCLDQEPSSTG